MASLTVEQLQFLVHHKVEVADLFDASGYSRSEYMGLMSRLNLLVAYGVPACKRGHTLKTRAGHCVQCHPENLSYLRRHNKPGYIYVASSEQLGMLKIGSGDLPSERVAHLCQLEYGGAGDWVLEHAVYCSRAGKAEFAVHYGLGACRVEGHVYVKNGAVISCRELFQCDLQIALNGLNWAAEYAGESAIPLRTLLA